MVIDEVAVDKALAAAPPPVADFIGNGFLSRKVVEIGTTHALHIDTMGKLSELSRNMLLGLSSPAETIGELVIAGTDSATAQAVLQDLNKQVFMPVRDAVKSFTQTGVNPYSPDAEVEAEIEEGPAVASPVPAPVPAAAPPPQPTQPLVPPMQLVDPAPAPVPPPAPFVPPAPVQPLQVPQSEPLPVRTMAADMQAVKEHRAPEPIPVPPEPLPAPQPSLPPTPRPAPPPPNLPGAPLEKQYGVDPYREPLQ